MSGPEKRKLKIACPYHQLRYEYVSYALRVRGRCQNLLIDEGAHVSRYEHAEWNYDEECDGCEQAMVPDPLFIF